MRLRRSALSGPGISRKRRGKGFAYYGPDGSLLDDEATVERIKALVIPPAWKKVWICPFPNGHVQAVGTDAAGRRQYLYHPQWQQERAEEKFDRVLEMSSRLPGWRAKVSADLAGKGLGRDRVLALALHLLDQGYFRAGGEQYAEENESYGLATLLCEHVRVRGEAVSFDYPAKSGVQRRLELADPEVARAVKALLRRGNQSERLLVCRAASGWTDLRSDDLNARFKELVGAEFSVKDLRTWHGTVLAAVAFADADPPVSKRVVKRVEAAVMKEVAESLGNTPAVARGSYVDPRVVAGYEQGLTIGAGVRRAARIDDSVGAQAVLEKATRNLILKVDKGNAASRRPKGAPMPTAA
ncbi:DNA topoisomerase IB [Mycolicibacterium sp. J2]|uniref:DNA topoisomerase IB n=1 Tax=Mycolicibacterium sp. J2 TaxID=2993511 RepID=UPI00224A5C66|nr:DNA topoisomerase IB [Mycolicibacterium sp. J2]MCX2712544.1 DNA topoisomerase IB [Mycolicibacterium sp. J2]